MTAVVEAQPEINLTRSTLSRRRRITNVVATAAIWLAVAIAVLPIVLVTYYVIVKGGKMISWEFLNGRLNRQLQNPGGGIHPAIAGTLLMTGVASLFAIPLGVLGAIYLNEYGKQNHLARTIRT